MKILGGWLVLALCLVAVPLAAQDRQRWEIAPFAGWETSGSYPVVSSTGTPGSFIPSGVFNGSNLTIDRLRVDSSLSFGTFIDYSIIESLQLEFMWARNQTTYSARDFTTGLFAVAFDSDVDQFQFGVLFPLRRQDIYGYEKKFVPFVAGGLGFTHESNNNGNADRTAFAFNLGGGAKYYLSRNFGLRGDIRWMPTFGASTPGLTCDVFGNCFNSPVRHFEQRANFSGGFFFRF